MTDPEGELRALQQSLEGKGYLESDFDGNMSIQLHPGEKFLQENSNEPGRQDESYYIVETAQGARTFVGFRDDADPDEFIREAKRSEKDHQPVDYLKYINYVDSRKCIPGLHEVEILCYSGRHYLDSSHCFQRLQPIRKHYHACLNYGRGIQDF